MMRYILQICSISVIFTSIRSSFLMDDPGDALYLTEYIERGDIETVMLRWRMNHFRFTIFINYELINLMNFSGSKSSAGCT